MLPSPGAPKAVLGTPSFPSGGGIFLASTPTLFESGLMAASLFPRVRHCSEVKDIDLGQLVGRHVEVLTIVVRVNEFASAGPRHQKPVLHGYQPGWYQVGGGVRPVLGPFRNRTEAVGAEQEWLLASVV